MSEQNSAPEAATPLKIGEIPNKLNTRQWLYEQFSVLSEEIFTIQTDKITFIAGVFKDNHRQYKGSGFIIFKQGDTLQFSHVADKKQDVMDKCRHVAQRIARVYHGELHELSCDA